MTKDNNTEGRLQQASLDLLHGSDVQFHRHNRLDIALVKNLPLALIFLPAADIPTFVGEGRVDLGITGHDQVAEHEALAPPTDETGVEQIMDLGFGKCSLCVQVPEGGKFDRPDQLVGRNVVTSFTNLAQKYFMGLEGKQGEHVLNGEIVMDGDNVVDRSQMKTAIKYVGGSVEAACALGVADGIVDLVGEYLVPYHTIEQDVVLTLIRVRGNHAGGRLEEDLHCHRFDRSTDQVETSVQRLLSQVDNGPHPRRHHSTAIRPLHLQCSTRQAVGSMQDYAW